MLECRTPECDNAVPFVPIGGIEPDPDGMWCYECEKTRASHIDPPLSDEDWLDVLGVNTPDHGHATIDNFDATDSPTAPVAAREFVRDTVASSRHTRVKGLYLFGSEKGTGKSHLAVGIMRAIHLERPDLSFVYDRADRLIARIQDSFGKGSTDRLIEQIARCGVYVLDDLGREKGTESALRTICTILDERQGRPTVVTSNALHDDLGAKYAPSLRDVWERVDSRLGDNVYRFIHISGHDRRSRRLAS